MRSCRIDFNKVVANSQNHLGREYFSPLESKFTYEKKKKAKLMLMLELTSPQ